MLTARVIPCLLLRDRGLVKTVRFRNPTYVGDPINAVKIFNEKEVDELIFLDIAAAEEGRSPNLDLIRDIASECFMPFCYGGGVGTIDHMRAILAVGAEKVCVNRAALHAPDLVRAAADRFGSQSVVVSIDAKRNLFGAHKVYDAGSGKATGMDVVEHAVRMEEAGAGEIMLNSVDRDGTMEGYDIDLVRKVSDAVGVPVIACGGAGRVEDFADAVKNGHASAVAAGSMFVFYGKHRAVLISYPDVSELERIFA